MPVINQKVFRTKKRQADSQADSREAGTLLIGPHFTRQRGQKEEFMDYRAGQEEERIFHFKMF